MMHNIYALLVFTAVGRRRQKRGVAVHGWRCRWPGMADADGDGKQEMKRNARFFTTQFKMHLPDVSVLSFPIFRYMGECQEIENPSEIR